MEIACRGRSQATGQYGAMMITMMMITVMMMMMMTMMMVMMTMVMVMITVMMKRPVHALSPAVIRGFTLSINGKYRRTHI